ncbi:MAG: hypothetical protein J6B52_04540 [Clostridia bacterium]|nr:hypothetical protein [Clostridia bacterium]
MSVSFGGFNSNTATFKTAADLENGCPVKISESNTVEACANGEAFCGIAAGSDNGYASVQLIGAVTAVYSGSAPAVGYSKLASDGAGVKASDSGREYLVLAVDEAASTVTFLM